MPTWINSTDGSWTNAANWSGGVPNAIGAQAIFFLNTAATSLIVSLPNTTNVTVGVLDVSLNASSLFFSGTGSAGTERIIFNNGASNAQVNVAGINEVVFVNTLGLQVELASNTTFNVIDEGAKVELAAPVFGSGALLKTGAGRLFLNNTHSFSGNIQIEGGLLDYQSDASLGSGAVTISNDAYFLARSTTTVDNAIGTVAAASGTAGAASIGVFTGATLTLTGALSHLSSGTVTFGRSGNNGTIVSRFSSILENAVNSSYAIASGTLQFGNGFNAANLFNRPGTGSTVLGNAILDTAGFITTISNLDMNGGTIRSSSGILELTINDVGGPAITQTGTITGTAGNDSIVVNATNDFSIASLSFTSWGTGSDLVTLNGSALANTLTGNTFNDLINGFDGDDVLTGNGGQDILSGGNGNDTIVVNAANGGTIVNGDGGSDRLVVTGSTSLLAINTFEKLELVGNATLTLSGGQFNAGFDLFSTLSGLGTIAVNLSTAGTLNARGMSVEAGSGIRFTVTGSSGADSIKIAVGSRGILTGGAGTDILVGGSSVDELNGGSETDKLRGDGSQDILTGGAGADVFKYRAVNDSTVAAPDLITDFLSGTDRLNFSRIDTNPGLAGDQAFSFVGTAAFTGGGTASIRFVDVGADLRVEADVNGDGTADMHIMLMGSGAQTLTAADFVL